MITRIDECGICIVLLVFISLVRSNAPQSWDDQSIEVLGSGLRGCVKFNSVRLLNFCCKIQPFLVAGKLPQCPGKKIQFNDESYSPGFKGRIEINFFRLKKNHAGEVYLI